MEIFLVFFMHKQIQTAEPIFLIPPVVQGFDDNILQINGDMGQALSQSV